MGKQPRALVEKGDHFEVPLSRGEMAKISPESAPFVENYCWTSTCYDNKGRCYGSRRSGDRKIYLHQFVLECAGTEIPDGFQVDHKNRNRLDNRLENLRLVTPAINRMNQETRRVGPRLYHSSRTGLWRATVKVTVPLGVYKTKEEAIAAYERWLESEGLS